MTAHPFYNQEAHGPYQVADIGDLVLEEGHTLRACQIAYATHGKLNAAKDNAILVTTWYSGTSKIMEQAYVGEDRALDPAKYFIVIANQIGSGLGTSPHNSAAPNGGPDFPRVRIGDDVRAQRKLLEQLGIERLALVTGGSMGAQQTYEWAIRYPEVVQRAAAIAGCAKNKDHNTLFARSAVEAIAGDPGFAGGHYKSQDAVHAALRRHAGIFAHMGLCTEFYRHELWREIGFASVADFVNGFVTAYFLPMDPNDLLCQAWKWQHSDISRHTGGDLKAALGRIKMPMMVLPISTDLFFPPAEVEGEAKLIPNAKFNVLESQWGHFGLFGTEPSYNQQIDKHLRELLATPAG